PLWRPQTAGPPEHFVVFGRKIPRTPDMKDQKDKQTGDLLASPDAVRQARYAERMKAKGMRQRKFWLTDDEYEALRECLEELRAAQGGGSDPASA
ncbi:plasmid repression protein F, partial [Escherichia sp. NIC3-2]|uniref:plasmid repression protein F n=1 Tax=Escherichia sp. NIC3-2 TaxID=2870765 RepID=UPI0021B080DD